MPEIPFNVISTDKDDSGKRVLINSVSGALINVKGTVIYGPHKYIFSAMAKKRKKKRNGKMGYVLKWEEFITEPYWRVLVDGYNLELNFVRNEIKFIK